MASKPIVCIAPTKHYTCSEVEGPITYAKNKWYIGYRAGIGINHVKCIKGGASDDLRDAPIFKPEGASMAFELKLFDWIMDLPE